MSATTCKVGRRGVPTFLSTHIAEHFGLCPPATFLPAICTLCNGFSFLAGSSAVLAHQHPLPFPSFHFTSLFPFILVLLTVNSLTYFAFSSMMGRSVSLSKLRRLASFLDLFNHVRCNRPRPLARWEQWSAIPSPHLDHSCALWTLSGQ